jgi:hypothetical protein
VAASFGDLAQSLIEGGLAPQAARIIANALANAASPTFSQGRDQTDATPVQKLRLITPDTRRYELTNLDYSPSVPFNDRLASNPTAYDPGVNDHPYKDSQPLVSAPPLSNPRVQAGPYCAVDNVVEGNSPVSRVGLKLRIAPGRHLRADPATGSLEAVSMTATSQTPSYLGAEFIEREQSTDLLVSLRNIESGSWIPAFDVISGSSPTISYSIQNGSYFRFGNVVTAWCRLACSSVNTAGASGSLRIVGLPFNATSHPGPLDAGSMTKAVDWVTVCPQLSFIQGSGVGIALQYFISSGESLTSETRGVSVAQLTNTSTVGVTVTYEIS